MIILWPTIARPSPSTNLKMKVLIEYLDTLAPHSHKDNLATFIGEKDSNFLQGIGIYF